MRRFIGWLYWKFDKWRRRPVLVYMSRDELDAFADRLRKEEERESD